MAPIGKYYSGQGEKVMKSMKKRYGSKTGKSVFYATASKRGLTGSGAFSAADIKRGYKIATTSSELHSMDVDSWNKETLAKRRLPGHLRRSEGKK